MAASAAAAVVVKPEPQAPLQPSMAEPKQTQITAQPIPTPAPAPASAAAVAPAATPTPTPNVQEHLMYKNRLQEYTQKASLQMPLYQTINEGAPHAPRYRSTVLVKGATYASQGAFTHRKAAEQDAARVALIDLPQKAKEEESPIIREDTVFCKLILNEYAVKVNLEKASYTTTQTEGLLPVFCSSLVFNGVTYTGRPAKNKKEAEQLAARSAILSILDSESEGTVMSEIIKSKHKLYAVYSSCNTQNDTLPLGMNNHGISLSEGKEVGVDGSTTNMAIIAEPSSGLPVVTLMAHPPLHVFRTPKTEESSQVSILPIEFVPAASEQPSAAGSISGTKRNRKSKKKANKKPRLDSQLSDVVLHSSQVPSCSVAQ